MTEPDDDRCVARSERDADLSEAAAFPTDEIVRAESRGLERLATRLLADPQDREDLVQEVWLQSVRHPPSDLRSVRSWLHFVARRAAARLGERRRLRAARERLVESAERDAPMLDALERAAVEDELRRRVALLKDPYREVVQMRFLDELPIADIAGRLGRSEGTIRSQLKRGLDQLRDRYVDSRRRRARAWLPAWWRWELAIGAAATVLVVALVASRSAPDEKSPRRGEPKSIAALPGESSGERRDAALELAPKPAAIGERASAAPNGLARATAATRESAATDAVFTIRGRTLDVLGNPVANADVFAAGALDDIDARWIARSDANGDYRSSELREAAWIWAEELDRGLTERIRVHAPGTMDDVPRDLTFRADFGRMSGIVRDARGSPIAGAAVRVLALQTPPAMIGTNGEWCATYVATPRVTGADGVVEFPRIHLPRVDVLVTAEGRAPFATSIDGRMRERVMLELPEDAALSVEIELPDGAPAAGASVILEHPDPLTRSVSATGADGTARFERIPPGAFTLVAIEGSGAREPRSTVHRGELWPGERSSLHAIRLSDAYTIGGTAHDASTPLAGWTVSLWSSSESTARIATVAADGGFSFAGCADTSYSLHLRPPGPSRGSPHASVSGVAPGRTDVRLRLHERDAPSTIVRGTLTGLEIGSGQAVMLSMRRLADGATEEAHVDRGSRRFEIGPLAPGAYELHATHSSLGAWKLADVSVAPGDGELELGRISAPRTGSLRVRWSHPMGSADESFRWSVDGRGILLLGSRGHSDPRFDVDDAAQVLRVPDLLPGEYSIRLQGASIATQAATVRIREDQEASADLELREGTTADVRIQGPRLLAPDEIVHVRIHSASGTIEFPVRDRPRPVDLRAIACFRCTLAPGANRIEVSTSGGLAGEVQLDVRALDPLGVLTVAVHPKEE